MKNSRQLFLSLYRRKMNLFIFFVMTGLSFLFLSAVIIFRAVEKNIEDIEKTYGISCVLEMERDKDNPELWEDRVIEETGQVYQAYLGPRVSYDIMDRVMAEVDEITGYEAGNDWMILLPDYQLIKGQEHWSESYWRSNPEAFHGYYDTLGWTLDDLASTKYATYSYAVCNSEKYEKFMDGSFELVEGRHITLADDNAAIISKTCADMNGLKVGDTLRVDANSTHMEVGYPWYSLGGFEVEIVGLFEMTYEQVYAEEYTSEWDILENQVILDHVSGSRLDVYYGRENQLSHGHFYVESPSDLNAVMEQIEALDWIDWRYYTLYRDDMLYKDAIEPIRGMKNTMFIAALLIGILGYVLLSLLMSYSVKKRTREMGILMALGIPVKEIRSRYGKEALLLAGAAFVIALFLSMVVSPLIGNGIYSGMNSSNEAKQYTKEEIESVIMQGDNALAAEMAKDQRQGIALPDTMAVRIEFPIVFLIGICEFGVVILGVNEASGKILKQKPMEALSLLR